MEHFRLYEKVLKEITDNPDLAAEYLELQVGRKNSRFLREGKENHFNSADWETIANPMGWCILQSRKNGTTQIVDPGGFRRKKGEEEDLLRPVLNFIQEHKKIRKLQQNHDNRYAIVFSGGGAKGAYEIGVWKYLEEIGIAKEIRGISGASVGALNSLLFVSGDCKKAEELWRSINSDDLLPINEDTFSVLFRLLSHEVDLSKTLNDTGGAFFSQERLRELIDLNASKKNVCQTEALVYSSLTILNGLSFPQFGHKDRNSPVQLEYRCWEPLSFQEITDVVLASAALPVAYPQSQIGKKRYIDGGVLDNTPIRPLLLAGFEHIIVVHLNPKSDAEEKKIEKTLAGLPITTAGIHHIWPRKSLGQTLQISEELTMDRMEAGYQDAVEQLKI